MKTGPKPVDIKLRFWAKVAKTNSCWEWLGAKDGRGYGKIKTGVGTQLVQAHRLSWMIHYGDVPGGLQVCHHCDNKVCVNPEHLFLGTQMDNIHDMIDKGRKNQPVGVRVHTHKLTEEDVRFIRQSSETSTALAIQLGVNHSAISNIRTGTTWKWLKNVS